jgi:hypothetical protein
VCATDSATGPIVDCPPVGWRTLIAMRKSREWIEEVRPPRPRNYVPGPVPTIGEFLSGETKWFWAYCERIDCGHNAPIALAPFAIRWGLDASSDLIRARLRCSQCGKKGDVALKRPSWAMPGWQPWPEGV